MPSALIHKNLVRQICRYGDQNLMKFLQQKVNPQVKLDVEMLRQKISCLKHTAAQNGLVSLSAPQIKLKNRIFVIMKQQFIRYSQWTGYEDIFSSKKPQQCYDAIINPQLIGYSDFKIIGSQQCPTLQGMKFKVWIPLINKMRFSKYLQFIQRKNSPSFKTYQQSLTGFYGRVFDHEYRHLQGLLVNLPEISNNEVYLTNQAIDDPQNFQLLKTYRMETKYFNQENIDKYIQLEKNRMKQEVGQKAKGNAGLKQDFMSLPDQIDDKIKEKLKRSYEMAKTKGSLSSTLEQNTKTSFPDIQQLKRKQSNNKQQEKRGKSPKTKFSKK